MAKKGVVNIRGKNYKTVVMRVNEFREHFSPADGWAIRTWLVSNEGDRVVVSASICDKDDHVVATGFAEEDRTQGNINRTSALENCETSAIGRALAAFGLGGEEYCSADELVNALKQQESPPPPPPEPKEEPPKKFNPRREMEEKLDLIASKRDPSEVSGWLVQFLRHEPLAKGALSVSDINVPFKDMVAIYEHFKEEANRAYEMGFKVHNKDKE